MQIVDMTTDVIDFWCPFCGVKNVSETEELQRGNWEIKKARAYLKEHYPKNKAEVNMLLINYQS